MLIKDKMQLIQKDLIFKEDFINLNEAFEIMSDKLLKLGLVKEGYLNAIKEREKDYPTGIDLSAV